MNPETQSESAKVVLGEDGSVQVAAKLTRQQRRSMMRREAGLRAQRHVGVFTRGQRRWLAHEVAKEIDQAASAAAAAMKRGDQEEASRQGERLNRAVEALA